MRLDLSYDGTGFAGWARQPGLRTVQGTLEEALRTVLRLPEVPATVVAGRTDAGVHATGQVCHVDVPVAAWDAVPGRSPSPPAAALVRRLSGVLPADVVVTTAAVAPPGFDARFSALARRYSYHLWDAATGVPPLRRRELLAVRGPLDVQAMTAAGQALTGLHDFAAFCRRREGATTVRTLLEYAWRRTPDGVVEARVVADAFCHSMVRALVGAAIAVGQGRRPPSWPREVLAAGRRSPDVAVAAAHGLVLREVVYPDDDRLAERARAARSRRTDQPAPESSARPRAGMVET